MTNFAHTSPVNLNFKKNNEDFTNFNKTQPQSNNLENLQNDFMDIDFLGVEANKHNKIMSDQKDVFSMEKELFINQPQPQVDPLSNMFTSNQAYSPSIEPIKNHNILKLNSLQDFNKFSPKFDIDRTSLNPRIRTQKSSEVQESQSPKSHTKKDPFEIANRTNFLDFEDLL